MTVIDWLMAGDPAIRWQVMRDLTDTPAGQVEAERSRVTSSGWGGRLLELQEDDGQWGGGSYTPKWTSTTYTLLLLRHLGVDPTAGPMREAVARVRDGIVMGAAHQPFFSYRGETCIAGMVLAIGSYFGADRTASDAVADWLLAEQLPDGGWNCQTVSGSRRSSFHTTISALEGLLEHERSSETSSRGARARAEEYLLERQLLRRQSTGEIVNPRWTLFSFPPRWHYDALRALDHLREEGTAPDGRAAEAVELVERKRLRDGRWPLQNHHRGTEHFPMEEGPGKPSRWNTLRALRVLRWYGRDPLDHPASD